jgi:hypothetical protein
LKRLRDLPLYLLALVASAIAILDYADVLNNVTWIHNRLAPLTLLALGVVCWYLAAERRTKWEHLEQVVVESSTNLAERLVGAGVRVFQSREEYLAYVTQRILGAQTSIEDVTWGKSQNLNTTKAANDAYVKYREAISRVASSRQRKGVVYREIITFEYPPRVKRARENLKAGAPNYWLAYYDLPYATPLPPLIQFIIIDRKEVLFGSHRGAMPGFGETALAVQHPEVAALFLDYFNVAWGEARVIKDYHHTDWELFEQIASRVEAQGDSRAAEKDGQVSGPAVASTDQA